MSTHLLPVGSSTNIPVKYRPINMVGTMYSSFSYEHDRILYICLFINGNTYRFQKLNLLTNELSIIGDIPQTSFNSNSLSGMVVNDIGIFMNTYGSSTYLYKINLDNLVVTSYTIVSYSGISGMGILDDKITIVMTTNNGFLFFNTRTNTYYSKSPTTNSISRYSMAVGKNIIMSSPNSNSLSYVEMYNMKTDVFSSITNLPVQSASAVCYGDGKFYIAQVNRLTIYNEETETVETNIVVPWTKPKTISYTNGVLFVVCSDVINLYIYNIRDKIYKVIYLPWTIPNISQTSVTIPCAFKGYFFLPYRTMCVINYTEDSKYNMGYVFDQYVFITNRDNSEKYEYDDRFIELNESCLTIKDGDIEYTTTEIDEVNHIKKISINKSDYNKIKSIKFIS